MFRRQLGNQRVLLEFSPSMTSRRRLERPQKLTNGSPSFITSFLEGFAWRYGLNSLRINGVVAAWCTPQSWCTHCVHSRPARYVPGLSGKSVYILSLSATATSLPPTQQHRVNRLTHNPTPPHVPHTPVLARGRSNEEPRRWLRHSSSARGAPHSPRCSFVNARSQSCMHSS